jgi:hypothetical protein
LCIVLFMSYPLSVLRRIVKLEKKVLFQIACIISLFISHFFLSYDFNGGWWHSLAGTVALVFFGYLIWGKQFFYVSGLNISSLTSLKILAAAVILTSVSVAVMSFIAKAHDVFITTGSFTNYVHNFFYILNEEIILGAMMLYLLIRRFKVNPFSASLGLAVVVSLAHFVLYKWYFRDKDYLEITTLITLTSVVFVKNNLIIRFKQIGYAWALHFGWMAVMYGSSHYFTTGERQLTDLEKFDLYLGSSGVMLASLLLACFDLFYYFPLKKKS